MPTLKCCMARVLMGLLPALLSGCVSGPYRITQPSGILYARDLHSPGNGSWGQWGTDEITGYETSVGQDARIEHMDPVEFDRTVAALRARHQVDSARKAADFRASEDAQQARIEKDAELRRSIWMKDYTKWYDLYLSEGYTVEESEFLAARAAGR